MRWKVFKAVAKWVYRLIPAKHIMFEKIRRNFNLSESLWQHLTFEKPFEVSIPNASFSLYNKTCIENDIFWNGIFRGWEAGTLEVFFECAQRFKGTLIDVGANTGIYSLVGAATFPHRLVYAFEPHPVFLEMLKSNFKLNYKFSNVVICDFALANEKKRMDIGDYAEAGSSISVNTISLDEFCEDNNVQGIDIIKVDIEGMEPNFIRGALKTIRLNRPLLFIEVLNDLVGAEIDLILCGMSYEYYAINEKGVPRFTAVEDLLVKNTHFRNFLLISRMMEPKNYGVIKEYLDSNAL